MAEARRPVAGGGTTDDDRDRIDRLAEMRRWIEANRPALTDEYMSVEDMLDFVDRLAALLEQAEEGSADPP